MEIKCHLALSLSMGDVRRERSDVRGGIAKHMLKRCLSIAWALPKHHGFDLEFHFEANCSLNPPARPINNSPSG
jgi:hypothetical protein